ncbi:MAG: hypothetical protein ABSF44_14775 [Candidatus Bathyarchaeia archaeon]
MNPRVWVGSEELKTKKIPPIPELINELKLYGYKTTPSGNLQYGAPERYHDDCVTALALAAWQLQRTPPQGVGAFFLQHQELKKKGNIFDHPFFHQ